MTQKEIFNEIEETLGLVPEMFQVVPESALELEWKLFKEIQLPPGPIPMKERELIGVAIAATTRCPYCAYFHTKMARVAGATSEEIEHALQYAKSQNSWSIYIHGHLLDYERFKNEIDRVAIHVSRALTNKP